MQVLLGSDDYLDRGLGEEWDVRIRFKKDIPAYRTMLTLLMARVTETENGPLKVFGTYPRREIFPILKELYQHDFSRLELPDIGYNLLVEAARDRADRLHEECFDAEQEEADDEERKILGQDTEKLEH